MSGDSSAVADSVDDILQFLRPLVPVSGLDPANLPMVNSVLSWL